MIDNTKRLSKNKPKLFTPTLTRHIKEGSSGDVFHENTNSANFLDTSLGSTGSFKYNQPGTGLVSTQQLNVDWSDFSNHTFFNSAQVKTNVALNKIINEFPFDGTKGEVETFLDKLTGFEKWVYDQFPKNKGFLVFSGSNNKSEEGTYVVVKDTAGSAYPTLSRKTDAESILDPVTKPMTIEFWVYLPEDSSVDKVEWILSKTNGNNGFAVFNRNHYWNPTSVVSFVASSGSVYDGSSVEVERGTWTHLCWVWNRSVGNQSLTSYRNFKLYSVVSSSIGLNPLETFGTDLYVGSGSQISNFMSGDDPESFRTFSGSLDELRIWHKARTEPEIKEFGKKSVFASDDLKLYFKFNEPSGSNSAIVLDHSRNSLHGKLSDRAIELDVRNFNSASFAGQSPMTFEKLGISPVLFPLHQKNIDLRVSLLHSASLFDSQNPSLITNLVPKHLLLEGKLKDGLSSEEGDITGEQEVSDSEPGNVKLGGTQVLLSLLYTWAKFFDELKLYIQAFSTLDKVGYNNFDTIPDEFLNLLASQEGIDLPPLFVGTSITQYIDGDNLTNEQSFTNQQTLQFIQNQIWRRILINLPDVVKSKGTIHSIKSFIRATGIDPDNVFRIREYGGPTKSSLEHSRETKTEYSPMLDFSNGGFVKSPILSSSRNEPGWPNFDANNDSHGFLTSGSFTVEGLYKFGKNNWNGPQSLFRLFASGSNEIASGSLLMNLVVDSDSSGNTLSLYSKTVPSTGSNDYIKLDITGVDLFDGNHWNISFGKLRKDDVSVYNETQQNNSIFVKLAKQENGEIVEFYSTSSFYSPDSLDVLENYIAEQNGKGLYFCFGSQSLANPGSDSLFLENPLYPEVAKTTNFNYKVNQIRFWSKYITDNEFKEHTRNFKSVGVSSPKNNWNFTDQNVSGSYNRLRIDASMDQIESSTNQDGEILFTDFTQNNFHLYGNNFVPGSNIMTYERFEYSFISPKIDEGISENKVRIRSFIDEEKLQTNPWAQIAPVYETNHSLSPKDSTKMSIDFSIVDALDQDIITIFSSLDEMNNYIGNPELMFAEGYKDLEILREIYFNKLQDKINLRGFFEFYKWFDSNIGTFVAQLIPRKTKFLGTNFVIESHVLERNKIQYKFEDHWLGDDIRSGLKPPILLQLLVANIGRY